MYREVRRRTGRWEVRKLGSREVRKSGREEGRETGREVRDRWWWAPPAVHLNKRLNFRHYL